MPTIRRVAISLGSNLGPREANLRAAVARLARSGLDDLRLSSLSVTRPVACAPGTPDFVNGAVVGQTGLEPLALLDLCLAIEAELGRPRRRGYHADRIVDLDLLLVDELEIRLPALVLPHPGLREREFVLRPLAEIAPDWPVPPDRRTVSQCLADLLARTAGEPSP